MGPEEPAEDASSAEDLELVDSNVPSVFVLTDLITKETQRVVVGQTYDHNRGLLEIGIPGYGSREMDDSFNQIICLEQYGGSLRLLVWADINDEEATHVIDLVGAKLSNREEED